MRLRYLHLRNYPPIDDIRLVFASGSPMERECAIRFVVGLNGSGKSNLLRAVAELFLALADERLPPFPATLVYELGRRDAPRNHSFVLDFPGAQAKAALWLAEDWHWPDGAYDDDFRATIESLREIGDAPHFRALIPRGAWPQTVPIALPKAVLAYTTGAERPWQSVWKRNQEGQDWLESGVGDEAALQERPPGWGARDEALLAAAAPQPDGGERISALPEQASSRPEANVFRRPVLLNEALLKCALLSLALPQAFVVLDKEVSDWTETERSLQALLERGGWRYLVSVGFRGRFRPHAWDQGLSSLAHDWWLSAGEVLSTPHPTEARRTLLFDLKGRFDSQGKTFQSPDADALETCSTQGDALLALLGGRDATPFERFTRLLELNRLGLFDDLFLRLRRAPVPEPGSEDALNDLGVLRYGELSDGEQMVLGRMALFHLLRGQEDALLLLDEPETHFNDKWKREIVEIIDEAIGDSASDVLIATHSAIVLSDVFNDEVVMVEKTDTGSAVRKVAEPTFATDPSALMMTVFEADDSIGKRAETFILEKLKQTSGTEADIAMIDGLIARMGTGFYRTELRTLLNRWKAGDA